MNPLDYVQDVTTLLAVVGSIVAWVAKLRWSKEFADAKEEIIRTKDEIIKSKEAEISVLEARIQSLTELSSNALRTHRADTIRGLEDWVEKLEEQLAEANATIKAQRSEKRAAQAATDRLRVQLDNMKSLIEPTRAEDSTLLELEAAAIGTASASTALTSILQEEFPDHTFRGSSAPMDTHRSLVQALIRHIHRNQ